MSKVPAVILTLSTLDVRLRAIAETENRIASEQAALDADVLAARTRHEQVLNPLADEVKRLRLQLTVDALRSRDQLLTGKAKTVRVTYGELRYQQQPAKVDVPTGAACQAAIIDRLKERDLFVYVRSREEIDRQALNAAVQVTDDMAFLAELAACGLRIVGGQEDVLIKPNHEIVRDEADGKAVA